MLEERVLEMLANQDKQEAHFYGTLLQKLNAIDLLQVILKMVSRGLKSGEKMLTFKKELSFGMLQVFREEIAKAELSRKGHEVSVDYELIDRAVRKLRFFKNFAQSIRLQLYQQCRYEVFGPNEVIAPSEELDRSIFVIISGIASLTVNYVD